MKVLIEVPFFPHSGAPAAQLYRLKFKHPAVEYYPLYIEKKKNNYSIINCKISYGIIRRIIDKVIPDLSTLITMNLGVYVNTTKIDLAHTMDSNFTFYNVPTIYERSAPTIYILNNWYNLDYNKLRYCYLFEKKILNSKKCIAIIAWTYWSKRLLVKYYNLNEDKIKVLPPPIPTYKNNLKNNKSNMTILFLGNDFYRKGGDITVKVFKKLSKEYPKLTMIIKSNKIPLNYKLFLKNIKNILIIDKFVNMFSLYKNTDIFFLPTRADTYSISLLEISSLGIASVISNLPSLKEIAPYSIHCNINDEKHFYKALKLLIEDEDERKKRALLMKKFVNEKFNPHKISEQLFNLYNECLV